jgi:hypothetical protein
MAVHTKTIEYVFPTRVTSLAAATRYDFTAITLYIPETTTRTFRSVRLQVGCRDTVTTATSMSSSLLGIKLGSTAFSDASAGIPSGSSGESQSFWFERDVTSYFASNFGTGASQTCQVGVQFGASSTINIWAKLIITYECEDQQTRVKTVRIPLDSGTGQLTATLAEIGTSQIPALSTFLPESSKTIREVWVELWFNEYTVGTTTDSQLGMQIDTETEVLSGAYESVLASACFGLVIYDQTTATWVATGGGSTHAFKLRTTSTSGSTFNHVGIVICVTYEYDHTNSSTILNSLILGMDEIKHAGATTSSDETGAKVFDNFLVEEPATVTMVQSGALVLFEPLAAVNINCKIGAGSARTYTETNRMMCGQSAFTQRIDSGGAGGSALTLARGRNTLYWEIYVATLASNPSGFGGFLILNYTSGKHASGDGVHNKSTAWSIADSRNAVAYFIVSAAQFINIPESSWFRGDITIVCNQTGYNVATNAATLYAESAAGELSEGSFEEIAVSVWYTEAESGVYAIIFSTEQMRALFDRWITDPQTNRMDIEGSRRLAFFCPTGSTAPLFIWFTYHCITKSVAGDITGSGGGTVTIHALRDVDGVREELANTSRSGNGAFSMTIYDDVDNTKVVAREDATHVGSSERGVAT